MVVIIWTTKDEPSAFCQHARLKQARIIKMDDDLQEIEEIQIDGQATLAAVREEVLDDWLKVLEAAHDFPGDGGRVVFVFSSTGQKLRFYNFKKVCGGFENRDATHHVLLGELLRTDVDKHDGDKRIEEVVSLLKTHGLKKLAEMGYLRDAKVERTAREGIFGNAGYHYYGDEVTRRYHLMTCEELDKTDDRNLVGLGKTPSKKDWLPCPLCIHEILIPPAEITQKTPAKKPAPSSRAGTKPGMTPAPVLGWEKRLEKKRGYSDQTSGQIIQRAISSICDEYGMHAKFVGGTAFITTFAGEWFFAYNDRPIRLRHKNYAERTKKFADSLDYYHLQYDRFPSPLHALKYIFNHDMELKRKIMWEADSELAADQYYYADDGTMNVISRAVIFAAKAHKNAVRKGAGAPYILHPLEAAVIVASITDDEEVIAAALLHDVLEDTEVKASELQVEFGARVRKLVEGESEDKRPHLPAEETWKERKSETIDHLYSAASEEECIIALADKLSNLRACYRDSQEHGDALWEKFNVKDKAMHAWYYKAVRDALGKLQDTDAWMELSALVDKLFQDEMMAGGEK